MKHTRLRPLAGLAAGVTVAALALSGCAGGGESGEGSGDGAVTLTVWHYYNTDGQVATLDEMAKAFTDANPDVTVDYQYIPVEQMTTKAVTAAGAKTGPDVIIFGASGTYDLSQSGAIEPMDWFEDFDGADQFPEGAMQKIDGTLYGVQGFVNLLGLWYNQDLMTELGIDAPPATIDELEADMAKAVAAGKQGITLTGKPGLESQWQGFPWFTSEGFSYGDAQAEPMANTYAMLQDWVDSGYLSKEATTWDQTVPFQEFAAGSSLFAVNGNWQIAAAQEAAFEYGVAPLPITDEGGVLLGGEVQNIGAFSKHKDLAQEYLETTFFSTDGELALLKGFGAIPTRSDAASAKEISDDPILSVFAEIVADQGRPSPSPEVPSKNVNSVEGLVGDYWSKAIAGAGSPQDLADELMAQLTPLLNG
ncbi:extracellular solute-binding protein [Microbacterium sp. NPDC056044]|uniref:sugar ABC transporter substrate-binding protein n=1 Tax=Microbacterium sp. NPDC056044 TaxID=3345690 RepID=UPI0035D58439